MQQIQIIKNFETKTISVSRTYNTTIQKIWQAYTQKQYLDQWWAPSPWRCETKTLNFEVGGYWLYAMISPDGSEKHYGRTNYVAINPQKNIDIEDVFCDESGVINTELPVSKGQVTFTEIANNEVIFTFFMQQATVQDLETLVEMGFEEGITLCFEQLNSLLKTQF